MKTVRGCPKALVLLAQTALLPLLPAAASAQEAARPADAAPAAGAASAAPAADGMTLEDAVKLALANNERAKKANLRVDTAEGQLDRARGAFLPTLNAGASGTLRAQEDRAGRNMTSNSTVTLSQPIVSMPAFPQYSQASHQLESEKWGARQDRRVLMFDTAKAFVQTLTAERVLEAAKRRLERARANRENAEARAAAQLAGTNDATRATLEVTTAQREVVTAEGAVARAYLQLGYLVGAPVKGPLAPPDRTTRAAESVEAASSQQVDAARDRRPDLRAQRERTLALRQSAKEPLYRLFPTLTLNGTLRVNPTPLATEVSNEQTATVNLGWALFDAGFRYADRKTRLAQAESQALDERLLERSVGVDVEIALVSLKAARETFRIAEEAVEAARKNREETEILYRQGLARALELTDANAKQFDAEVGRASARLAMVQSYLELRLALGHGPTDEQGVQ